MASILGGALGAFGSSAIKPVFYNKGVNRNLNFLGDQFKLDDATLQNFFNNFTTANADTIGKVREAASRAGSDYDNLFQSNAGYNPIDTYERLRSGNLGALSKWSGLLEGAGRREDNNALAALGMGGRPSGSFSKILSADRVSRNVAPVLGSIMANLGRDTSVIGGERSNNLGNLMRLIGARTQAPLTGYGMELDPMNALLALRSGQTGLLRDQADVARANNAGFYLKPDTLSQVGNSLNAANDALWQNVGNAMSVYSSLYGGGMLGGGGGISTGSPQAGAVNPWMGNRTASSNPWGDSQIY